MEEAPLRSRIVLHPAGLRGASGSEGSLRRRRLDGERCRRGFRSHAAQAWDALDAARTFHGTAPLCPVLLAAGSTIDISVDALAQAGIVEVLRRPVANSELATILARCLRSPGALGK